MSHHHGSSSDHHHHSHTPKIHHGGSSAPHAAQVPDGLYASSGTSTAGVSIAPQATYNGGYTNAKDVRLRIANGGAGQSGLIGAWADAFIKYMVKERHVEPFLVAWYLGDTTESLGLLAAGSVDVAVTYNEAAEKQSKRCSGSCIRLSRPLPSRGAKLQSSQTQRERRYFSDVQQNRLPRKYRYRGTTRPRRSAAHALPLQVRQKRNQHQRKSIVHYHWTGTMGPSVFKVVPPIPSLPSPSPRSGLSFIRIHTHRPRHLAFLATIGDVPAEDIQNWHGRR